jgi:AcrR family transcriptional regulator
MPKIVPTNPRPYHHGDLRRALIEAAIALVTEEQDWEFSLREVARRADVSHNAPYNHFSDKTDLLSAVAAVGFERLRDGLLTAISGKGAADVALLASGHAYVRIGTKNPALYRLMFGSALADPRSGESQALARVAGMRPKEVLQDIIRRGAQSGVFAIPPDSERDIALATLSAWSMGHGLTMLIIDGLAASSAPTQKMIDRVLRVLVEGLRHGLQ